MQTHKFLVTIQTEDGKAEAADYLRYALEYRHARRHKKHSVRSAKPWNGDAKPAAVTIRRLTKRGASFWFIYVSGRPLEGGFLTVKSARQYLRDRHPNLTNRVTVRR